MILLLGILAFAQLALSSPQHPTLSSILQSRNPFPDQYTRHQSVFMQHSNSLNGKHATYHLYYPNDLSCSEPALSESLNLDQCTIGPLQDYHVWKCEGGSLALFNCEFDDKCGTCRKEYALTPNMSGQCWYDEDLDTPFSIDFEC